MTEQASAGAALPLPTWETGPTGWDDPRWADHPGRSLVDARSGAAPRMPTLVQVAVTPEHLWARFTADAVDIRATLSRYKDKVWQEQAVEIYLRPPGDACLYEFQVSPIGTVRDLRVHDPGGAAQRYDDSWSCLGWVTDARIRRDAGRDVCGWDAVLGIPWSAFGASAPAPDGASWRIGAFRLEWGPDEFSALRAGGDADAHGDGFLLDMIVEPPRADDRPANRMIITAPATRSPSGAEGETRAW
ncbi:carbohydrate-binding family 9-like protein [Microbacterium sp. 179-I 3D2 NHS]|uniref:carbohydrate-binding family 9-like protein n=1 Tax=Microbacterium sp. 179-I 3D2 NHS TaxID=3235178 RepID=UPI0039A09DC0